MQFETREQESNDCVEVDLKQSEAKYEILFNNTNDMIFVYKPPRDDGYFDKFVEVNDIACKRLGYTREELINLSLPDISPKIYFTIINKLKSRKRVIFEAANITKGGEMIPVEVSSHLFYYNEKPVILSISRDISIRKQREKDIKYLSEHDVLTGLYDRTYFENLIKYNKGNNIAPKGVIMCDVNGLKIINDTMGHQSGDILIASSSNILKDCTGDGEIVSRIGGDEFAIVVTETSENTVQGICKKIKERIKEYNEKNPTVPISIALGFYSNADGLTDINELIKRADDEMYREKLSSKHDSDVFDMLNCLLCKGNNEAGYLDRVQKTVTSFAQKLNFSESHITDLRMLAKFYDIGKATIADEILFKKDKLNDVEWGELRRHSEIGSRIYKKLSDFTPLPDWILKHHEWWNGRGYPLGLKGDEIPLESRIIAIVDAYAAMTSNRSYRPAMTTGEAIAELKKGAGKQFDPNLIEQFIMTLQIKKECFN